MKLSNYRKQDMKKMLLAMAVFAAVAAAVIAAGVRYGIKKLKPKVETALAESKEQKAEQKRMEEAKQQSEAEQQSQKEDEWETKQENKQNETESLHIPTDCFEYKGHSYYYFEQAGGITWEEAKEKCEERGGHLLTIASKKEQKAVYGYINQYVGFDCDLWIGIREPWETWVTGEPVSYTNWGEGEPDGSYGQCYGAICNGERSGYGYRIDEGQWDDLGNDDETVSRGGYICEWDTTVEGSQPVKVTKETKRQEKEKDYIIPDSGARSLDRSDIEGLGKEELRLARNEVYARYGRLFDDEALQNYFDEKDWYHGSIKPEDFKDSLLNEYEKQNLYLILDYEEEMGYR